MAIQIAPHYNEPFAVSYRVEIISNWFNYVRGGDECDMIAVRKYRGSNVESDMRIAIYREQANKLRSKQEYLAYVIDQVKSRDVFFFENDGSVEEFVRLYNEAYFRAYPLERKEQIKVEPKKESPMDLVVDMYKDYTTIVEKSKKILDKIQTMSNEYKDSLKKTNGIEETS